MLAQPADSQAGEKKVLASFNAKLKAKVQAFSTTFAGVSYLHQLSNSVANFMAAQAKAYFHDIDTILTGILNSPSTYGFQDATSYGDGATLVWCKCKASLFCFIANRLARHR